MLRLILITLLLTGCATQSARLFDSAARGGNYSETYPKLLKLAQSGNSEAQWMTGYYLLKGQGIEKNEQDAFGWFSKSAAAGHPAGMNWLGNCYVNGWGTEKNPSQAIHWYEKSSALGNSGALTSIGDAYYYGYFYPKDYSKALTSYINGLARGNKTALERVEKLAQTEPSAQRELGGMYYYGKGVKKDYSTAYRYFNQCALRNDGACFFFLGKILQTGGYSVEQDRDRAKLAFQKGAALGNPQARAALDSINSAESFAEGLGQALLIGLAIFGAAAAAQSSAYSDYGSSPDYSAMLNRPRAAEVRSYSSSNANYPYRGSSGTQYQYDLSKPGDQIRYEVDPAAQLRDGLSVDPRRDLDRDLGQVGGGIRR
jgi:TPR repeat protein